MKMLRLSIRSIDSVPKRISLVLFVLLLGACAKRTVYVPPEWLKSQPPPEVKHEKQQKPRSTSSDQGPILKTSPQIKESDISSNPQPVPQTEPAKEVPQPQFLASMHLVDQAKASLAQGKIESAISLFEQAIQVDVYNGEAFFGLARAWRMKGSMVKASEFARKAELLFQDQPGQLKEVYLLEAAIFKQLGDTSKAEVYAKKASRL